LLAKRSAEAANLHVCCSNLKEELATTYKETASLAQKTQGLEQGLAQVITERYALRAEADHEAATARGFRTELAEMKTELELKVDAVAQVVQMTEVARAKILQWKHKEEGDILSLYPQGLITVSSIYLLIPFCLE
jgi:predicted  nucleic acid-binding Zn-ribbon protein